VGRCQPGCRFIILHSAFSILHFPTMRLIVGLGNPGREYVGTRHNIGFEVLDAFAARAGWATAPGDFDRQARSKFDGLALDASVSLPSGGTEKVLLLKPRTFMNLSGRAVQAAMAFYQLTPADVMVVLDDLALPCGKLRIRPAGSDGGHNGLRDIQRGLGTNQYPRLRVGIDAPPLRVPGRDYVLGRFSEEQRKLLDPALKRAVDALLTWIDQGVNAAMNRYNAEEKMP
jgi:peptidyl-tRNA hydrolase, PTH1 family